MEKPRQAQTTALAFIGEAVEKGCTDIVISAPTGIGKSGIGIAACLWACRAEYDSGGYYLVTQKALQDQLEHDFPKFVPRFRNAAGSLKSSVEYPCPRFGTCMAGSLAAKSQSPQKCSRRMEKTCPYVLARQRFNMASVAVTNYPYLFTEHMYVSELKPRSVLIADECHTLEHQIAGFIEVIVDKASLDNWAPGCRPVPEMPLLTDFTNWLSRKYVAACVDRLNMLSENISDSGHTNRKMQDEFTKLKSHLGRVTFALENMQLRSEDWVYWQERVDGEWQCTAKPLTAAPFVPMLINEMGAVRVYMSAYPGPKDVFCRNLGLSQKKVGWLELDSAFPVENREIHMTTVGSMSRKYLEQTLPRLLEMCATILEAHPEEKGIIHCHSYALGQRINDYFRSRQCRRILFSTKASERNRDFHRHRTSTEPTVMLSPSIAEGFSFDDDLARFQIIAKVPYPYLGDRQVAARMEIDRDWYTLQTVMTVLQACGRIVRSHTDHGATYILDHDFLRLFNENPKFFPKWFQDAFKWY